MSYQHQDLFEKWFKIWEDLKIYQVSDLLPKEKKEYILVEFPYPSGSGLHIGHAFSFVGADVYARFQRMKGKNVLFPMGWDAFGLPTENYAIKTKSKPQEITAQNTATFKRQMKKLQLSFDWSREINTTDPQYYQWTQWIFIQLFKKGLAFKKEMPINWCPQCKIGLANEEVVDGKCERCGAEVTRRNISQWIVKITDYADRLLQGLEKTNFIEKVKRSQINWIGASEGAQIIFPIELSSSQKEKIEIFTTRPDTLWGATFMVLAPEHPLLDKILKVCSEKKNKEIKEYIKKSKKKSDLERVDLDKEKTGVFTGLYALNPVNKKEIPVWISDFVLSSYGTGAIMAVPAHDQRDWEFAQKFGLEIIPVIKPDQEWNFQEKAYVDVEKGTLINSGPINNLSPDQAFSKMINWLQEKGIGRSAKNYHLRDWIFSRQHYWGEPIPMIFCPQCGWQPAKEEDLPIELPKVERYHPTDTGESPLSQIKEWVETTCPLCGGPAKRETDTMPNWAGSDWYFLRYIDPQNQEKLVDLEKARKWLPVDIYIGGDEHNTLHLLYSRFIYQFLWDLGVVPSEHPEPYQKRISHGVILGPDSQRMSKSKGNVVDPEEVMGRFDKYGSDILRIYLMFIGPFEGTMAWNDQSLTGIKRFLDKIEKAIQSSLDFSSTKDNCSINPRMETILHQTIQKVSQDIKETKFNTAVAGLMEFLNEIRAQSQEKKISVKILENFLLLLSPFAPIFCEEQWQKIKSKSKSIFLENWPEFDSRLTQDKKIEFVVQVNGKVREKIDLSTGLKQKEVEEIIFALPQIKKYLLGKKPKKIIFLPDKLINIVI
ncbi:leucine--tRNA ligase [Patescibacteria group bacterium]|nr:leucine--tRNA ligase [Patescibacteria group bacterium]